MVSKGIKFHSMFLGVMFSLIAWTLFDNLLMEISLIKWIFIEIIMGFMEYFCNFVKKKMGLSEAESDPEMTKYDQE